MKFAGNLPRAARLAKSLFLLNALIWLLLGGASLLQMASRGNVPAVTLAVVAVLMLGNALALLLAGLLLAPGRRWVYLPAVALLLLNIVLTFTDQFGLFDLLTLIVDIAVLALLVLAHRTFWS